MATATIATSGGDYTTLTSWASSLPAALTEPEIAEIDGWLGAIGSQTLAVTTTATNKLVIRAKAGQETDYSTTSLKAGFESATAFAAGFELGAGCGHLDVEKIGIKVASNGNLFTSTSSAGLGASPKVTATDCWYWGDGNPLALFQGGDIGRPTEFTNCLGLNLRGHGAAAQDQVFINCTHVLSIIFAANSGSAGFRNVVTQKCFAAHYGPNSSWQCFLNREVGSGNDAATDASADLLDNLVLANQYTDPANDDWSLKPSASLKGGAAGADIGFVLPSAGGGSTPRTITVTAAAVAAPGQSVQVARGRRIAVSAGALAGAGQSIAVKRSQLLAVTAAALTGAGQAIRVSSGRRVAVSGASIAASGQALAIGLHRIVAIGAGVFRAAAQFMTIDRGGGLVALAQRAAGAAVRVGRLLSR